MSLGERALLPMRPGQVERRTHDYVRHGTATLFAAFDVASGEVTGRVYARHRHQEFLKFLQAIDQGHRRVQIHLVLDNYRTHKHPVVKVAMQEIILRCHTITQHISESLH
jgi:DDE superfamily endonuclease